jgi:hypothetical protein
VDKGGSNMGWQCSRCGHKEGYYDGVLGLYLRHGCEYCNATTFLNEETKPLTIEKLKTLTDQIGGMKKEEHNLIGTLFGMRVVLDETLNDNDYRMHVGKNVWKTIKGMK